ncbi:MAG: hypothetical protein IKI99_04625 [Firmicutes bacterium]|nr:hypothetical protein [Bacillota bacterium]
MRKNKMMRLASCLLVAVLLTTSMISGTFAKYVTEASGTDTARVAKFDVNTTVATIDLFGESKIYDTKDADYTAGIADTDVLQSGDEGVIAPGTWGKFTYNVADASEVTVSYAVDYTVDEAGVPLQWSIDGTNWTNDLANVAATTLDGNEDITVMWRWAFEGGETAAWTDADDTTLGTNAKTNPAKPSVGIKVTFTQVD